MQYSDKNERKNIKNTIILSCYVDNSARGTTENEITPQSNYVEIYSIGLCHWEPRFELSVSQCRIDVTWFPFDKQTCNLVFESWMLPESILKLNMYSDPVYMGNFLQPDGWSVLGLCQHYQILLFRLSVL